MHFQKIFISAKVLEKDNSLPINTHTNKLRKTCRRASVFLDAFKKIYYLVLFSVFLPLKMNL